MSKRLLTLLPLLAAAACGVPEDTPPREGPPSEAPPLEESVETSASDLGVAPFAPFPYRRSDHFVSLSDFLGRLRSPGWIFAFRFGLSPDDQAVEDFVSAMRNAPPGRLGAKAGRVLQVHSDSPVYLIDGYAVLPDENDRPADPSLPIRTLCATPGRCISISRDHASNRETAVMLVAARTIIVENAHTDGLSLATMSESLLFAPGGVLDVSPHGAILSDPNAAGAPALEYPGKAPFGIDCNAWTAHRSVWPYRPLFDSPVVATDAQDLCAVTNPDLLWERTVAAQAIGAGVTTTQGFAGLPSGSWLAFTHRSGLVRANALGQTGGDGRSGTVVRSYTGGTSSVLWCSVAPAPSGPGGASGVVRVLAATRMLDSGPAECSFPESALRLDPTAGKNRHCLEQGCGLPICRAPGFVDVCTPTPAEMTDLQTISAATACRESRPDVVATGVGATGASGYALDTCGIGTRPASPAAPARPFVALTVDRADYVAALLRLQPLELVRRMAMADRYYRIGDKLSARAAYLDVRSILTASLGSDVATCTSAAETTVPWTSWSVVTPAVGGTGPAPLPASIRETCGLYHVVSSRLLQLDAGLTSLGYAADFTVPRSVTADSLITQAQTDLTAAQAAVTRFQFSLGLANLYKDQVLVDETNITNRIAELHALYQPGGSLYVELDNARRTQRAAMDEIARIISQIRAEASYMDLLDATDRAAAAYAERAAADNVVREYTKKAGSAVLNAFIPGAGEVFGVAFDTLLAPDGHMTLPPSTEIEKELARQFAGGLPSDVSSGASLVVRDLANRTLNRLRTENQVFQLLLRARDQAQDLQRALLEENLAAAKIKEAQANELRLTAQLAEHQRRDAFDFDALARASYLDANRAFARASESVFLAKRAVERDGVPFTVSAGGAQTNLLDATLASALSAMGAGPCASESMNDIDVRWDSVDCYSSFVRALALQSGSGAPTMFTLNGSVTKTVPLTTAMRAPDGLTYDVEVELDLAALQAAFGTTAVAHKLANVTPLLDTGVSSADVGAAGTIYFDRREGDRFWLGPTTAGLGLGLDPKELLTRSPDRPAPSGGALDPLFLDPSWTPVPTTGFSLCRGPAATNSSILATNTPNPACQLSSQVNGLRAYGGRSAIGTYHFRFPTSALVGTSHALRVRFDVVAKSKLTAACTAPTDAALCAKLGKSCGTLSTTDDCGTTRTITCGTCGAGETCGFGSVTNVCAVAPGACGLVEDLPSAGGTFSGSTAGLGAGSESGSCGWNSGSSAEHVYRWTAPFSGPAHLSMCGGGTSFDSVLYVRAGDCHGAEVASGCSDDGAGCGTASDVTFSAVAGTTYYLVVDGYNGASGTYSLTVTPPPPPPNSCSYPEQMPSWGGTFTGVTSGTGREAGSCASSLTAPEHVYEWVAPSTGWASASTCGSSYDTVLYVRGGTCGGAEVSGACNDDSACGRGSQFSFWVTAGTHYFVIVDGFSSSAGTYTLRVDPPTVIR